MVYCILVTSIAVQVLVEHTSQIKESIIELDYLAIKMLEKCIITETKKREITDSRTGLSTDQRMDQLLDILHVTVKVNEKLFGWFIQVLKDYNTVLSMATADKLMNRYDELMYQ